MHSRRRQAVLLPVQPRGGSDPLPRAATPVGSGEEVAARQLGSEVAALRRGLSAAADIHCLLAGCRTMEELLGGAIEALKAMVNAESAGVLLYDSEQNELVLQKPAFNLSDDRLISQYRVVVAPQEEPITTAVQVFLTGEPVINNAPLVAPGINRRFIELYGVQTSVTLPLRVENRTTGVLHVINKRGGGFTGDEAHLLMLVALQLAVLLENFRLVQQLSRREQEAKLLYDLGAEISASLDTDQVLNSVAEKARFLVRAEMAAIALVDGESGYCDVRQVVGNHTDSLRNLRFQVAGGTAGQVLRQHRPVCANLAQSELDDLEALDLIARHEGHRWVLAVPLKLGAAVLGLLYVWWRSDRAPGPESSELLARLSVQAAVAVDKAQRFAEEKRRGLELHRLNQLIEAQHLAQKRSLEIHRELTQLVLEGRGMAAITLTLAHLVQNPVLVQDQFLRVVACDDLGAESDPAWQRLQAASDGAPTADSASAPDPALAAILQAVQHKPEPVQLPPDAAAGRSCSRLMAPIVVEREVLGYITVLASCRPFQVADSVAVEQAAMVYALEMLKQKTALEVEYRLKGDLLFDLCRGRFASEQEFLGRAAVFGYDLTQPRRVLVLEFDPGDTLGPSRRLPRLLDVARTHLGQRCPGSLLAAQGEVVLVLAPVSEEAARALAAELQARAAVVCEGSLSVGIGAMCRRLDDYPLSYREARQVLVALRRQGRRGAVAAFADLGVFRLLSQVRGQRDLKDFVQRVLGPLLDYDAENGTALIETLDQFLKHMGNRRAACRAMFVHVNTLNYRLQRIAEIAGIDLDNHTDRLNLDLALRALEALGHGHTEGGLRREP